MADEQTDTPNPTAPCICDPAGGDQCPCAGRVPLAQCPCYSYKTRRAAEVAAEDAADTPPVAGETFRFTFTVTPIDDIDAQTVIDDMRHRFGRKPLIHVIGRQPSGTHVDDAVKEAAVADVAAAIERSFAHGSVGWLDEARAAIAAYLPHQAAERDAETTALRAAHESVRRGYLRVETQRDDLRTAVLETAGIDPDTANEDTDYLAVLARLRAENAKLAELWHEVVDTPQDGGEATIWLRRWMTSGWSIAEDRAEYTDVQFVRADQVHEVIRAYLVANNLPVPAVITADLVHRLAAADLAWSAETGDEPATPPYIRFLAEHAASLRDPAPSTPVARENSDA